jgi:fructosamine-3-kinase
MQEIRAELERLLGGAPTELRPVGGGDIGDSFQARTQRGAAVFVKSYGGPEAAGMVAAEARGLAWLAEAGALRVPEVVAVTEPGPSETALLVLEWIDPGPPGPATDEWLGRGLARLHDTGAPAFGFDADNFIGRLPQSNEASPTWAAFYRDRRLGPLVERARDRGLMPPDVDRLASKLLDRLEEWVGPDETPDRLHGDLWGGNWLCAEGGEPVLIDPAVYGGHREIDLAMMRLFGGFSERVFAAYAEATELAAGAQGRVPLYQLCPLLVHLNLFGSSYLASVERALRRYVS